MLHTHLPQLDRTWTHPNRDSDARLAKIPSPSSPRKQRAQPSSAVRLQPHPIGIDPSSLVGKTLKSLRRSSAHPNLTLTFADGSVVQVLVDGYDPRPSLGGIPKSLEMDSAFMEMVSAGGPTTPDGQALLSLPDWDDGSQSSSSGGSSGDEGLVVEDCALVRLRDKAFERRSSAIGSDDLVQGVDNAKWDQDHLGVAFKFEGRPSWHCVWATVTDYDDELGECKFRSYEDVFLKDLQADSPGRARASPIRKRTASRPLRPQS